eukprot:Polyplicarium_translucidae@DN4832_c0_g1_i1.p1
MSDVPSAFESAVECMRTVSSDTLLEHLGLVTGSVEARCPNLQMRKRLEELQDVLLLRDGALWDDIVDSSHADLNADAGGGSAAAQRKRIEDRLNALISDTARRSPTRFAVRFPTRSYSLRVALASDAVTLRRGVDPMTTWTSGKGTELWEFAEGSARISQDEISIRCPDGGSLTQPIAAMLMLGLDMELDRGFFSTIEFDANSESETAIAWWLKQGDAVVVVEVRVDISRSSAVAIVRTRRCAAEDMATRAEVALQ